MKNHFLNDWYEYVEYGTVNPVNIILQRNGFSREAATYIAENERLFVETTDDGARLKQSILTCGKTTVGREAQIIFINMPELFWN